MVDVDEILVPHKWYLYEDGICWPVLIQLRYKLDARDPTEQDAYVFEVFGRDQEVYNHVFPMHMVLSNLNSGQLRPVEINSSFLDLFK